MIAPRVTKFDAHEGPWGALYGNDFGFKRSQLESVPSLCIQCHHSLSTFTRWLDCILL